MKVISIPGVERPIELHKRRVKRLSIRLKNGAIYVSVPRLLPYAAAVAFVRAEKSWILKSIEGHFDRQWLPASANYKKDKEKSRKLVEAKLVQWNKSYNYRWGRVAIRDQSGRWGSCSSQGNLNFNWKILYLPEPLQDYLIVHEICHLKQPNHSKEFWQLVEQTIPIYKIRRKELKALTLS